MRHILLLFVFLMIAAAADRDPAGRYSGEWKSNGAGGNGAFRLSLEPAPGGDWKCEVIFTFGGQDVKTSVREVKVDQSKLEVAYDFNLADNALRSKITGELKGSSLEGRYQTTTSDGSVTVDEGVWTASRAK